MPATLTPYDYKKNLYHEFFQGNITEAHALAETYKKNYPLDPYLDDVFSEDFSGNFRLFSYQSFSFDQKHHKEQRAIREHAALSIFSYDAGLFFLQCDIDDTTIEHINLLDPKRNRTHDFKIKANEFFLVQRFFFEKKFDVLDKFLEKTGISLFDDQKSIMVYYKQQYSRGSFLATLSSPTPLYALFFLSGDKDHLEYLLAKGVTFDQLSQQANISQDKELFDCVLDNRSITETYFNERCMVSKSVFEKEMMSQGISVDTKDLSGLHKRKI